MSQTMISSKLLESLPPEMQGFEPYAVICNILPEPVLPILQTYGVYHINVPKPDERYALTPIKWAAMYMDKGDSVFNLMIGKSHDPKKPVQDNRIRMIQGAREIAEDLCQQMNMSDGPRFWGKFVLKGAEPTEEELVTAETRLATYFDELIAVGDAIWTNTGKLDLIDGRLKIAAKHRKAHDKPWLRSVIAMTECPACMETIRQGAKLCRHCGTELDPEFFAHGEGEKKPRRGKGGSKIDAAAKAAEALDTQI
jgi:hypothetical protein